jgi:hypothetical protein
MQDESIAGPVDLWITKLKRKIDDLEKEAAAGNFTGQKFIKDLGTCDTYFKKLYVRARDYLFDTPDGPQLVQDFSAMKVRLGRLRKKIPYWNVKYSGTSFDPQYWEKMG